MAGLSGDLRRDGTPKSYRRQLKFAKVCRLCGDPFRAAQSHARFCGPACKVEAARIVETLTSREEPRYESLADRLSRRHSPTSTVGRIFAAIDRLRQERGATEDPLAPAVFASRWGAPAGEDGEGVQMS